MKYIFLFHGRLEVHVDIYLNWIGAVSKDIEIQPVTFISITDRILKRNLVKEYRLKGVSIYYGLPYCGSIQIFLFLFISALINKGLVLHIRKRRGGLFKLLKFFLKNRIKIITEYEGDPESELSYLKDNNKMEMRISTDIIDHLEKYNDCLQDDISYADEIIVRTSLMREVWISRYNISKPIHILPDSPSKKMFYFDSEYRKYARKLLALEGKKVLIFSGGLRYGWQNLEQSVKVFLKLKNTYSKLFFIILTPDHDSFIATQVLEKYQVNKKDFLIKNIKYDQVNLYLNASDIAILLREEHMLNKMITTSKMGEYLAAGLPIISSKHIGLYGDILSNKKYAFLFDDIFDSTELGELIDKGMMAIDDGERLKISNWFSERYTVESCAEQYINIMVKK